MEPCAQVDNIHSIKQSTRDIHDAYIRLEEQIKAQYKLMDMQTNAIKDINDRTKKIEIKVFNGLSENVEKTASWIETQGKEIHDWILAHGKNKKVSGAVKMFEDFLEVIKKNWIVLVGIILVVGVILGIISLDDVKKFLPLIGG